MKRKDSIGAMLEMVVLLCVVTVILTACGSSGGGTSQKDVSLTMDNAPKAVSAAVAGLSLFETSFSLGEFGGLKKAKPYSKPPLRSILDRVLSISRIPGSDTGTGALMKRLQKKWNESFTEECSNGGTFSLSASWLGSAEPVDESEVINLEETVTFNSCKEGPETLNGKLTVSVEGPSSDPERVTMTTADFSYANATTHDSITMTDFRMIVTDLSLGGYELTGATMTITGSVSGTVDGDPIDTEVDSLTIGFSSSSSGSRVTVNGRIKALCLDGWITVATDAPIFTPGMYDCPTEGEIVITSGKESIQVIFDPDSKIRVSFNDSLVQTYDNCEEVEGLCVG